MMRLSIAAAFMLLLASCGGDPIPISVPASAESASQSAAPTAAPVSAADSDLGQMLVDQAGLSVYGFTDDVAGLSTCDGGCASAWPPVLTASGELPAGLDSAIFSVIERTDGTNQLKAGKWPLYLFAGDTAPGQTTGHLSGDVWFLAAPDGSLIGVEPEVATAPAAAAPAAQIDAGDTATPVATAPTSVGDALVNEAGLTLYGFTNDVDGQPTCEAGCADAWPPILLPDGTLPAGLDASIFSVVARPDGQSQLKAGKWPLYLFAGDTAPGQTTGHLSGDVWFVISPTGALIDGPAPATGTAPAAEDAAESPVETYGYGEAAASSDDAGVIGTSTVEVGEILVDQAGLSLYGFANDVDGQSTCTGGCAEAWPPVLVATADLPAGLDPAIFSVITRDDGYQLKAGKWPLYRFAGDNTAGQTTGHLSGDVWFLAASDGKLIGFVPAAAAPAPAQAAPAPAEAVAPAPTPVPPAPTAAPTPVPPAPAPTPTPGSYSSDY